MIVLILSIIGVIIVFSLLVIAHEYGHFVTARRNGVKVDEFGIGFPPKVFYRKKGGTIYSINALPIGGFVRLRGEDGSVTGKGSFASASFRSKTKIIMAGVVVNFLIAYVIFTVLLWIGMPPIGQQLPSFGPIKPSTIETSELTVLNVTKNSAAEKAGIKQGDNILSINSQKFTNNDELRSFTKQNAGKSVEITVKQNGVTKQYSVILGNDEQSGILGISAQQISLQRYSWWAAPIAALYIMAMLVIATLAAFGNLILGIFTRGQVSEQVAGPIGIVSVFSQVVNFGPRFILLFIASISLSLAVINALPLPALDGGRQFILILQKLGLKITPEKENFVHIIGFVALIGLMIIISISDISKLL